MPVLARLRNDVVPSHPYLDTPDFSYDGWLSYLQDSNLPIG